MKHRTTETIYSITRILDGIWAIDQDYVRCFLIAGQDRAVLLDTCEVDEDLPSLVRTLTTLPLSIVHTHADGDHIGASARFEKTYMHPSEFALLNSTYAPSLHPLPLREGEILELGGCALEVLLIPGHTPGSIALLDRERHILFSGDTVKENVIYMFGPGRSLAAYLDSLKRLYSMKDDFDIILPSHGSLPIGKDILLDLIEGTEKLLASALPGSDVDGLPCKLYAYKKASFYY